MSFLDSITPQRDVTASAVPNGSVTQAAGVGLADVALFPFSLFTVLPRLTNPAEQSAALGSVVTNDSPGFLTGFKREVGATVDNVTESAKTVARTAGGIVGALLPWWLWAILGVAALAWLLTVLAPYTRRSP